MAYVRLVSAPMMWLRADVPVKHESAGKAKGS
jgi:hypothetical protein